MVRRNSQLDPLVQVEIEGIERTQRKMEQMVRDLRGDPVLKAFRRATLLVQRAARQNAPVDTGRLRASIAPEVEIETDTILGIVGSNVSYAPYQELGTGDHAISPDSLFTGLGASSPSSPLITSGGGIRPKRFLQRALDDNRRQIMDIIEGAVGRITNK